MGSRRYTDPDRFLRSNSISDIRREKTRAGLITGVCFWLRFVWNRWKFRLSNWSTTQIEESDTLVAKAMGAFLDNALSEKTKRMLADLKEGAGRPFLKIRSCAPVFYLFSQRVNHLFERRQTKETKYLARMFGIDAMAAGFLYQLGTRPQYYTIAARDRRGPFARDLISAPGQAEIAERDGADMPLRFHQSLVEKSFPLCPASKNYGVTCTFKTYFGLRNWRRIPIYLLPVRDVIQSIPETDRERVTEQLRRRAYTIAAPLSDGSFDAFARPEYGGLPILFPGKDEDDWLLSFDPNRIVSAEDEEAKKAISDLRKAIQTAQRNGLCIRIVINFRDLLIVDNLRALVSRREFDPKWYDWLRMPLGPKDRWLRQMYGTPLRSDGSSEKDLDRAP